MPYPSQSREAKKTYVREYRKTHKQKNYNKKKNYPKKAEVGKVWKGSFITLDGEGWDGKYTIFALLDTPPLVNRDGLSTLTILDYIRAHKRRTPGDNAYVGFGLGYDFENILRDVSDADYKKLCADGANEVIFGDYTLRYIPKKMLFITWETDIPRRDGHGLLNITIVLQDVWGFFQSSFEVALKKWGIPVPEIISKNKASRDNFNTININEIMTHASPKAGK